jgi:hypothetical protein
MWTRCRTRNKTTRHTAAEKLLKNGVAAEVYGDGSVHGSKQQVNTVMAKKQRDSLSWQRPKRNAHPAAHDGRRGRGCAHNRVSVGNLLWQNIGAQDRLDQRRK